MRWPRRLGYLLLLVLLLVVPPVVLVEIVGWPDQQWPGLRQWVATPLTAQTLTVALIVLAWLVWLMLAATVTLTVAARIWSGARCLRRVPLPTPLQATATGVAGAAAFGVGAGYAGAVAPPEDPLPATVGTLDDSGGAAAADPSDLLQGDQDGGVVVPGGWLPREAAEQVAAAAGLLWLRRRRAYQPGASGSSALGDGDLTPLPATVTALQAALVVAPADTLTRSAAATAPQLSGSIAALPSGSVTLTGPGAHSAARGLLVTVVLEALRHPSPAPLVITRTALAMLLDPGGGRVWPPMPGVRVADSVDDAAAVLATVAGQDGPGAEPRQAAPLTSSRPVLILESSPPAGTVAAAIAAGAGTTVLLAGGADAVIWHVDAGGHIRDPRRPDEAGVRLCVLDPVAATDLLTVITMTYAPDVPPASAFEAAAVAAELPRIPRQATRLPPQRPPAYTASFNSTIRAAATVGRLDLRVLGEPILLADDAPVPIRRSASLQVLVFLAVHPDGATTGQLAEAIWPGLPAHRLTGRLYTTLSDLRTSIRAACGLTVIDHTDNRYRLHPAQLDSDLWRLRALAVHASTAVTNPAAAWQAVVDAYTGDLAAGHPWPWLDPAREATRRHVLDAYAALAAADPDPRRALDLLHAGIRVDPYNQTLHQQAIGVLTALGEHDTAAELTDVYTRRLTAAGLLSEAHRASHDGAEPVSGR
ncbi:hypothetical protein JD76_05301 [Micromonospora endolithica]|nr:hypothetical protein JD76_05301 [Micromonospora endolithica]